MKDYKSRIQEHEFDWRPDAWLSMESLIQESIPSMASKSGISWWKQIFGKGLTTIGIGIMMLSMEGQKFGPSPETVPSTEAPLSSIRPRKSSSKHAYLMPMSEDASNSPIAKGANSSKRVASIKPESAQVSNTTTKTNEIPMVRMAKSILTEQQSTTPSLGQASSVPALERKPSPTQNADHPFLTYKAASASLPLLVNPKPTIVHSSNTTSALITQPMPASVQIDPLVRQPNKSIQLGYGLSESKEMHGWQLSAEGIFPISNRLDWGAGLTYTQQNSVRTGPDLFGQSSWDRFSFLEGDIRLFWKFFQKSRHQLRAGTALGVQYANIYEVRIFQSPSNIEVTKEIIPQWRLSTLLLTDYRYYLNTSYHLGLQAGMQLSPKQNIYLKFSAGFSW